MVILSYILLIIAVAGAGIALVITHTALILGSLLFILSLIHIYRSNPLRIGNEIPTPIYLFQWSRN